MLEYNPSYKVCSSTTKMPIWLIIRPVRWSGITKPVSSGSRSFCSNGHVLDIPAWEVLFKKRMVVDVHAKKWVGLVPSKFRPELTRTHDRTANAASYLRVSLADFLDRVDDILFSEDDIAKEGAVSDLRDLTSNDDHGSSALQQVQHLCQEYGLAVWSDLCAVQKIMEGALAKLATADKDGTSLAILRREHESNKADWESS